MRMDEFKLFDYYDRGYNLIYVQDKFSNLEFDDVLDKPVENEFFIMTESAILSELHDCFIMDGMYCDNMKYYVFIFGECSGEFITLFYDKFIKFIVKYHINPIDFKLMISKNSGIDTNMIKKLSCINLMHSDISNYS